jgi:hypothetical protein
MNRNMAVSFGIQQANVIEQFSQLKVGHYNHQKDGSKWDLEKWKNDIYSLEVHV